MAKTLPASWYCSKPLLEIERQAVFMEAWYLLGPITRFQAEPESPVEYEIVGVRLLVENLDDGYKVLMKSNVNDHNISEEIVTSLDSFDLQSQILPHKLTPSGLLFASLSPEAPPFEEYFPGLIALLDRVDFTKLPLRRTLSYEGNFNWKTMVDGYQECLHCQYTHRSFSQIYPPTFYSVSNYGNYSRHITDPSKPDDGLFLYFFPICTLNVYGGGMTCFRVCPTDNPGITRMEFDYYHEENSDSEVFEKYFKFVRTVALEDYELCETAQMNLEKGVYCQGILNGEKESGVRHYQQLVRQKVVDMVQQRQLVRSLT